MAKDTIRNVVVDKGSPKGTPDLLGERQLDSQPQGTRNVERETWTDRLRDSRADARRERRKARPLTPEQRSRQFARARQQLPGSRKLTNQAKGMAEMSKDVAKAGTAAWALIMGTIWNLALLQLIAGAIYLIGLMGMIISEDSWWDDVDFANLISEGLALPLFVLGFSMSLICAILLLMIGILVFSLRGVSVTQGWSLPIMVICIVLHAVPGINLLPCMYLWYFYVVKNQIKAP